MKITLDLAKLVETGKISGEEAERLKTLAAPATASLALNILLAFGVMAVAGGVIGLLPVPSISLAVGLALCVAGIWLQIERREDWMVLGTIFMLVGSIVAALSVAVLASGHPAALFAAAIAFGVISWQTKSGLMAGLAVLALSAALGGQTGYRDATYAIAIHQPTVSILLFSALAYAAYVLSKRMGADNARVMIIAARTAILIVNVAFLVGSIWGDSLRLFSEQSGIALPAISRMTFIVGWALAIIAAAIFAVRANRPWLVTTAAVFGSIHFYTQWFERLGATPGSILFAGCLALGIAIMLMRYHRQKTA
jgi:iron complex transport system permease protein